MNVVVSTYQATVDRGARFDFTLRGYAGSAEPRWEHRIGQLDFGEQRVIALAGLDLPAPPASGGILELHAVRLDREPDGAPFIGMWVDAYAPNGGGYLIPTTPIRGSMKRMVQDNLQVFPGVVISTEYDTEIVLVNPIGEPTNAQLTVVSPDGLSSSSEPFTIAAWSAWRGSLNRVVRRSRRLLAESDGIGSASVQTSHKVLGFFGARATDGTLVSLDHGAPLFA